ncbi:MAG: hypothetical protein OHK0017_13180 [Patescibacteria group bacterium]
MGLRELFSIQPKIPEYINQARELRKIQKLESNKIVSAITNWNNTATQVNFNAEEEKWQKRGGTYESSLVDRSQTQQKVIMHDFQNRLNLNNLVIWNVFNLIQIRQKRGDLSPVVVFDAGAARGILLSTLKNLFGNRVICIGSNLHYNSVSSPSLLEFYQISGIIPARLDANHMQEFCLQTGSRWVDIFLSNLGPLGDARCKPDFFLPNLYPLLNSEGKLLLPGFSKVYSTELDPNARLEGDQKTLIKKTVDQLVKNKLFEPMRFLPVEFVEYMVAQDRANNPSSINYLTYQSELNQAVSSENFLASVIPLPDESKL